MDVDLIFKIHQHNHSHNHQDGQHQRDIEGSVWGQDVEVCGGVEVRNKERKRKRDNFRIARYFDYADFMNGINYPLREVSERQVSRLESFALDKK